MRIVYVGRRPMADTEAQQRLEKLRTWAGPGTSVDLVNTPVGPASIESMYEEYLSIPKTVELVVDAERQGYDAAVPGCFGDPGLDALREVTSQITLVGPGEAAAHAAAMLGERFSIVTITQSVVQPTHHQMRTIGLHDKLASVRVIDTPVLELHEDRARTVERVVAAGRTCITRDGADTIVLGCMTMAFMDVTEEIAQLLGVPVVNPAKAALKLAEALAGMGLRHSKTAYMLPPKLASGKVRDVRALLVGE